MQAASLRRCRYVRDKNACGADEQYIPYLQLFYCGSGKLWLLVSAFLLVWLLLLFYAMSVVAEVFLCPAVQVRDAEGCRGQRSANIWGTCTCKLQLLQIFGVCKPCSSSSATVLRSGTWTRQMSGTDSFMLPGVVHLRAAAAAARHCGCHAAGLCERRPRHLHGDCRHQWRCVSWHFSSRRAGSCLHAALCRLGPLGHDDGWRV